MSAAQIIWLVLIAVFIVLEATTVTLVSIWFCAGALAAFLVSLFAPGAVWVQIAVFVAASALSLLGLRPLLKKLLAGKAVPTNADANIGKTCQVVEEIQPGRFGRVRLEGLEWTAKADAVLPVGAWCRVDAIEGVKLVVSPLPNIPSKEVPPQ